MMSQHSKGASNVEDVTGRGRFTSGIKQWAGSRNTTHMPQEATPKIMEKTVMSTKLGFQYGGATDAFMRSGDLSLKAESRVG